MKKLMLIALVCLVLPAMALAGGKFYNFYEDGQKYMKLGDWNRAIDEFKSAISLEYRDKAQYRTYGMHFVDYFPHREVGICLYNLGDIANARKELELSTAFASSKRANEYLDKIGRGDAPARSPADKAEAERLAGERERIEQEKKRLAEQMAALELQKKNQDQALAKKAAEEQARLAQQEEERKARERELLGRNKLPTGALTYDPSRVTQVGSRLSIAVMPFDNRGGNPEITTTVQEKMITSLYELRRFKIIERSQIDKVLNEQKLGMTGAIDPTKAIKVGRMIGVDAILTGAITSTTSGISIDARLIDTESSGIITAKSALSAKNTIQDVVNMATDIGIQIYNDVPLVEGYVIKVEPTKVIFLDVGSSKGMRKGMKMVVYKEGEAITHPVSGEIMGKEVTKIGELLLSEVQEKMSMATIVEMEPGQTVVMGNKVVAK